MTFWIDEPAPSESALRGALLLRVRHRVRHTLPEVSEDCTLSRSVPAPQRYRLFDYSGEGVIASIPRKNKLRKPFDRDRGRCSAS